MTPGFYLTVSASIFVYIVVSTVLARLGYGLRVAVVVKRPRRNPRMQSPKPGCVMMQLQVTREFERILRDGAVGIVKLESVGDGTVTLVVEQTAPQTT